MEGHNFVAAGRMGDDTIWATNLVGKLGNAVLICIALDLDANQYKITSGKARGGATFVEIIVVGLAMILNNKSDDTAGEVNVLGGVFDVLKG